MKTDAKVLALFNKIAGDKAETVYASALVLQQETGKSLNRALADALEMYKLV